MVVVTTPFGKTVYNLELVVDDVDGDAVVVVVVVVVDVKEGMNGGLGRNLCFLGLGEKAGGRVDLLLFRFLFFLGALAVVDRKVGNCRVLTKLEARHALKRTLQQ